MKKNMNTAIKGLVLASLAAAFLPCSCSRVETEDLEKAGGEMLEGDLPIRFTVPRETGLKGTGVMSNASLDTFGVFACHIKDGTYSYESMWDEEMYESLKQNLNFRYMLNVPYSKDSANNWYDTTPERFWPVTGNLTVFAYAPYMKNDVLQQTLAPGWTFGEGYPQIQWIPDPDPRKQVDICLAVASNTPRSLQVPMEFHHATSQIYFAANYVELAMYEYIIIDSMRLTGLIGNKEVAVMEEIPYVKWQDDEELPRDASYFLYYKKGDPGSTLDSIPLPIQSDYPDGSEFTNEKGRLYVVPQAFDGDKQIVGLQIWYSLWFYDDIHHIGPNKERTMTLNTTLPACEWKPDNKYRYVLTIYDKTRKINLNVINDYTSSATEFYAMSCDFTELAVTNSVGFKDTLQVIVGPAAISTRNKMVEWYTSKEDSAYVKITPLPISYSWDPNDQYNRMAEIECLKETPAGKPAKIMVKTKVFNSEEERLFATCEYTVVSTGISLTGYPQDDYNWLSEPE